MGCRRLGAGVGIPDAVEVSVLFDIIAEGAPDVYFLLSAESVLVSLAFVGVVDMREVLSEMELGVEVGGESGGTGYGCCCCRGMCQYTVCGQDWRILARHVARSTSSWRLMSSVED